MSNNWRPMATAILAKHSICFKWKFAITGTDPPPLGLRGKQYTPWPPSVDQLTDRPTN
jgi:hypothetical protein